MTSLSRRSILKGAAALGGATLLSRPSFADERLPILRAAPASAQLAPVGYPSTPVWAYATETAGTVPGPEIRLGAGQIPTDQRPAATNLCALAWHSH